MAVFPSGVRAPLLSELQRKTEHQCGFQVGVLCYVEFYRAVVLIYRASYGRGGGRGGAQLVELQRKTEHQCGFRSVCSVMLSSIGLSC